MEFLEPRRLTKVRAASLRQIRLHALVRIHGPLTRNLESEPLELDVLVQPGAGQLMGFVVLVDNVLQDRQSLPAVMSAVCQPRHYNPDQPNNEIVVLVVDDRRNAAVGIDLQVFWGFMFLLAEVEIHRFVRQPEFFKDYGDFPGNRLGSDDGEFNRNTG